MNKSQQLMSICESSKPKQTLKVGDKVKEREWGGQLKRGATFTIEDVEWNGDEWVYKLSDTDGMWAPAEDLVKA